MANENKSFIAIPPTVFEEITTLLNQINTTLEPYVTPLTNQQRKKIYKMSDKSQAFVQKVNSYVESNPQFVPSFLNVGDFVIDFKNNAGLSPIDKLVEQLSNNLNDTAMVSGSEAMKSALMYYNNVKQADKNGVSNARSIYEDLQKRFPGRSKNGGSDNDEPKDPPPAE